jgi:hypothetical protein
MTGVDVAKAVVSAPWRPEAVLIHSRNPRGAATMSGILTAAGIGHTVESLNEVYHRMGLI